MEDVANLVEAPSPCFLLKMFAQHKLREHLYCPSETFSGETLVRRDNVPARGNRHAG